MAKPVRFAKYAAPIATVAIASLGGPLSMIGAILGEAIEYAEGNLQSSAEAAHLQTLLNESLRVWASTENLRPEDLTLGMDLTTETIYKYGLSTDELSSLGFDSAKAFAAVLQKAAASDEYWGTEAHYAVAEFGIRTTYQLLVRQIQASGPAFFSAVQDLRMTLELHGRRLDSIDRTLDELVTARAKADLSDLVAYLEARKRDWDVSDWTIGLAPSSLERRLRGLTEINDPTKSTSLIDNTALVPVELHADDALAQQRMLVVLGGPGSGKTWLARRFARRAASLAQLTIRETGTAIGVEVPIFTTWDQWTRMPPDTPYASLIESTFSSGLGHSTFAPERVDRLKRTFADSETRILLVIDSLDEAADVGAQRHRLRELNSLEGWRVVVTSRPAAWDATYQPPSVEENSYERPRVMDLLELHYPSDVNAFVQEWFRADPQRGLALINQLRSRPDLARLAVIPLILTFYCLLSSNAADPRQPLPTRRRYLYRRIVRSLLSGAWSNNAPGFEPQQNIKACERVLSRYAWQAIAPRGTEPSGWRDTFTATSEPVSCGGRALDHVVPKVVAPHIGDVTRRFVHRTLLEHFVAEHVAHMGVEEALDALRSHLHSDPEWEVAAPAALAAHNARKKGLLFDGVLQIIDPSGRFDVHYTDRSNALLLLAVAEESEPDEWTPYHQSIFHDCRVANAVEEADLVGRTAHWEGSNAECLARLLDELEEPRHYGSRFSHSAIAPLATTPVARASARAGVMAAIRRSPYAQVVSELIEVFLQLDPTSEDVAAARDAVVEGYVPSTYGYSERDLVRNVLMLDPSNEEPGKSRVALMRASYSDKLLGHLLRLHPSPDELGNLSKLLAEHPEGWFVPEIVELPFQDATDQVRSRLRESLLAAMPLASVYFPVETLARVLLRLKPTGDERDAAAEATLAVLLRGKRRVPELLTAFHALAPSPQVAAKRIAVLLSALGEAPLEAVPSLLNALRDSGPDRETVLRGLCRCLQQVSRNSVPLLVSEVALLASSEPELARRSIIGALSRTGRYFIADVVDALIRLDPTDDELREARIRVLYAIQTGSEYTVANAVVALAALSPTQSERTAALVEIRRRLFLASAENARSLREAAVAIQHV